MAVKEPSDTTRLTMLRDALTIRLDDIYQKQYLSDVIDHCCMRNGTVISYVFHYAWYSCEQRGCFPFLIFTSAPRFIKPCLLPIHESTLSSGKYWDCFINIATNVISVSVIKDIRTSIYDHNLKFEDRLLDAKTKKAHTAYGGLCLAYDVIIQRPQTVYKYTRVHDLIMANKSAVFLRLWYTS